MASALDWDHDGRDWPNHEASRFVEAGGLRWHLQCAGDPSHPTVVLLHGTGATTHSWRDLLPLLAERCRVISPDLPGHGFSGWPADRAAFTLPGMARAVAALLREARVAPDLIVGHSAGAAVAVQMCLEGLAAPRAALGLNAALLPLPGVAGAVFSPMARTLVLNPLVPRLFSWSAGWPGMLERLLDGTGSSIEPRGRELYRRVVASPPHVAAALAMMAGWDLAVLARRLPQLTTPLHLIVGERDRTLPPDLAWQAASRIPGAAVTVLPALGHLAHEEQPQRVATLIEAAL
ncbi:alpha/beta fold hydrolase BchO [Variovorax sp. YR752]|uniref:alpha/beta fold hydrolase BchO n=1 Tax=Variovorax sp. YR752 TaxID=1884383 RepID=UPI003137DF16